MTNNEKKIILILFIIAVLLAGYTWGYPFIRNLMVEKTIENIVDITEKNIKDNSFSSQESQKKDIYLEKNVITEILESSDEIYLESTLGADYIIYLDKEEKEIIRELLTELTFDNENQWLMDDQYYNFALHLQSQNTKVYFGRDNILVQRIEEAFIYWADHEGLVKITDKLQEIYLVHVNKFIQEIQPSSITLEVIDEEEGKRLSLTDKALIELLKESIVLNKVIDGRTLPTEQTLYKITITSNNRNAVLVLLDDSKLRLNIIGEDAYFEYAPELITEIQNYLK